MSPSRTCCFRHKSEHAIFFCFLLIGSNYSLRLLLSDVKDIKVVINYDFPNNIEDYVHRIGRTGRAKTLGTSYTFFTFDNYKQAKDLVKILDEANQEVEPRLRELAGRSGGGARRPYGMPRGRGGYGGGGGGGGYGNRGGSGANAGYQSSYGYGAGR